MLVDECIIYISHKHNNDCQSLLQKIRDKLGKRVRMLYKTPLTKVNDSDVNAIFFRNYVRNLIEISFVTVVVMSENMKTNEWLDYELEQTLTPIKPWNNNCNKVSGIIMLVKKEEEEKYNWFFDSYSCKSFTRFEHFNSFLSRNLNNLTEEGQEKITQNKCEKSYIIVAREDEFLACPSFYIEKALHNAQNFNLFANN